MDKLILIRNGEVEVFDVPNTTTELFCFVDGDVIVLAPKEKVEALRGLREQTLFFTDGKGQPR